MPYAERLFARFPEVLLALGHPLVPEVFNILPSDSQKRWTEVKEKAGQKIIRVSLCRRNHDEQKWPATHQLGCSTYASMDACGEAFPSQLSAVPDTISPPHDHQTLAYTETNNTGACLSGSGVKSSGFTASVGSRVGGQSFPTQRSRSPQLPQRSLASAFQNALSPVADEPESPRSPGQYKPWSSSVVGKHAKPKESRSQRCPREFKPPPRERTSAKPIQEHAEPDSPRSPGNFKPWGEGAVKRRLPSKKATAVESVEIDESLKPAPAQPTRVRDSNRPPALGLPTSEVETSMPRKMHPVLPIQPVTLEGISEEDSGTPIFGLSPGLVPGSPVSCASHHSSSMDLSDYPSSATCRSPEAASTPSAAAGTPKAGTTIGYLPTSSSSTASARFGKSGLKARRGIDLTLKVKQDDDGGSKAAANAASLGPVATVAENATSTKPEAAVPQRRKQRKGVKDASKYLSGGPTCHSPENKQAAVQLMFRSRDRFDKSKAVERKESGWTSPKYVPTHLMPLPGSFPNRRTVFIFDWDDTLCPTSWIRSVLKEHIADLQEWAPEVSHEEDWRDAIPGWFSHPLPDEHDFHRWMDDLMRAVIDVINVAQAFGVVCIVTNAIPGWVEKTIKKWLPQLTQYIYGHGARPPIKVIYGQRAYRRPTGAAAELSWVNDLGPYVWWKKAAMTQALDAVDELYRVGGPSKRKTEDVLPSLPLWANGDCKRIANLISIGDDEAEMQASELAARSYDDRRTARRGEKPQIHHESNTGGVACPSHWPWVKLVKLKECPHVKQLIAQLEELAELIPQVVTLRSHTRVEMDRGEAPKPNLSPRSRSKSCSKLLQEEDASMWVERSLRMQLV